ncbi:MAG: UDP-3-O-(3-hydroxymyristoyl)glucosamine N-acyltransferase, partial [Rhodocyclaceae bacterium]
MEFSLGELVSRLGGELVGDPAVVVRQIASIEAAREGELAFLSNPKLGASLATSKASAFILSPK